jgi:glycosyltransferase involved in cell wall biosynthesis
MMNVLSVIIPTFNRHFTLEKALSAYLQQTALSSIAEIVVVDDGSVDSTGAVVDRLSRGSAVPIRYCRQENKGPAAARNVGIREAASELILFTDDDIIPGPTLVAQHLEWHCSFPGSSTAVLGFVTWDPEVNPTPFMKWYGSYGALFSYSQFVGRTEIDSSYLYTCNVSLKTQFLRNNGLFDEDFKSAAYEDAELGYRLAKAGLRLLYNPRAIAYHRQFFFYSDACRKALGNTPATRLFLQKEAGQFILASLFERRSRLWVRVVRRTAAVVATALKPIRRMLDSYVPLPRFIYRLFFWYDVTRAVGISELWHSNVS